MTPLLRGQRPSSEDREVLEVAVDAALGQLALGLGERHQRVVLAGQVADPVEVDAAGTSRSTTSSQRSMCEKSP